jgi:hypothetical protein
LRPPFDPPSLGASLPASIPPLELLPPLVLLPLAPPLVLLFEPGLGFDSSEEQLATANPTHAMMDVMATAKNFSWLMTSRPETRSSASRPSSNI